MLRPKQLLSLFFYIASAIGISSLIVLLNKPPPGLINPTTINSDIKLLNGSSTTIKRLLNKPLMVVFWATWCQDCLEKIAYLNQMPALKEGKINIILLTIDSDIKKIKNIANNFKIKYYIGMADRALINSFNAFTIPAIYILNTNGNIITESNVELNHQDHSNE